MARKVVKKMLKKGGKAIGSYAKRGLKKNLTSAATAAVPMAGLAKLARKATSRSVVKKAAAAGVKEYERVVRKSSGAAIPAKERAKMIAALSAARKGLKKVGKKRNK